MQNVIQRNEYLDKMTGKKGNGLIKVITGIRRCGKSFLLFNLFYDHLLESGVKEEQKGQIRAQMLQRLRDAGYTFTPEEERNYILTGNTGGGRKGGSSGSDNSSDKAPAWSRPLSEGFAKAKGTLDAEDIDDFKVEVAKYAPEMDEDEQTYANSMILALEFLREHNAGHEDMAKQYLSGIPDYYREVLLPGY